MRGFMRAIIMAGGKGKRLNINIEKPLIAIEGETILERISTVLKNAGINDIASARLNHENMFAAISTWNTKADNYLYPH